MSLKLNAYNRDRICRAALAAAFDPQFAEHAREEHVLALRFYEKVIPPAEQKLAARLSKKWRDEDSCLRINVGGSYFTFRLQDRTVMVPANYGSCRTIGSLGDQEDVDAARAHFDKLDDLKQQKKRAEGQLAAMLRSVSTLRQLEEVWPAGRPYYEPLLRDANLPAPVIGEINQLLGLAA